jgi:hypothetical protein
MSGASFSSLAAFAAMRFASRIEAGVGSILRGGGGVCSKFRKKVETPVRPAPRFSLGKEVGSTVMPDGPAATAVTLDSGLMPSPSAFITSSLRRPLTLLGLLILLLLSSSSSSVM